MNIKSVNGIRKTTGTAQKQILGNTTFLSVGAQVAQDTAGTVTENGRKILKAGTILTGNMSAEERSYTAFVTGQEESIVGVLLHDSDVTETTGNASVVYFGTINLARLDDTTKATYTDAVITALKGFGVYVINEK